MDLILPFTIGGLAESKSSLIGYRGAWFRCKVHNMRVNKTAGDLEYYLEYIDYEGEKKEWVKVFEKNPTRSNQNLISNTLLMIRPSFPQWYYGNEVPEQFSDSDVTAIVDESWKVGDLVDWLNEGCYWSGTITKLLNKDMVEVKLPAPPEGEGKRYHAKCNELRPTLEWSLTKGWMVPLSKANKKSWYAARVLQAPESDSESESESGSEKSASHEGSSDDEYGDNDRGVLSGCRALAMPQGGPVDLTPPSATNSASNPKAQNDAILPSTGNLKPSSKSKSPDSSHGTSTSQQPAGTGVTINKQESGIGISIKQEQNWFVTETEADNDGPDEFLEKMDRLQAKLNYLMERVQEEHESCAKALGFRHDPSKDESSGK